MRPAHVRMAKETAVEREYNEENLLIIKNFFKRMYGKCVAISHLFIMRTPPRST